MPITPLPTIRKRSANKLANTNYVNEVADVVMGRSPFGRSGQASFIAPPWQQGYPVKITGTSGFGQYTVEVGQWKPNGFTAAGPFTIDDVTDFSESINAYLVNQGESNLDTNRIGNDTIIIAYLLFVDADSDLPVMGCVYAHAVRFVRQNPTTLNLEYTTHDAATADDVPDGDWIVFATVTVCTTTPTATLMQLMNPAAYT